MLLPNGAADTLGRACALRVLPELEAWRSRAIKMVDRDLAGLAFQFSRTLDHTELVTPFYELGLRSAMLGALDVQYEITTGRPVVVQFMARVNSVPGVGIPGFTRMPFGEAISAFKSRQSVTRGEWDGMVGKQRERAFTVAHLAKRSAVELVRREVAVAMRDGWTVDSFKVQLDAAFKEKKLSPLSPAHTATIIRTNTAVAHGEGRKVQQTTPAVRQTHPFWQYNSLADDVVRKTHRAADQVTCSITDPIWSKAYPPCGFNCRCNVISRRQPSPTWGDTPGHLTPLADLPDKGWRGR